MRSTTSPDVPLPVSSDSSLEVAALLTFSGGFLDAFTYVGHGHVFANAMSGNVVFLGVFCATGDWDQAFRHIPPIAAFFVGIFIAQMMRLPLVRRHLRRPAFTCLGLEVVFLIICSCLPKSFPDLWLVLGIALVAAMQNSSFTHLGTWSYNSVVTTSNLRRCAEGFLSGTLLGHDPHAQRQALWFGVICFCFLVGAAVGAFSTVRLYNAALRIPTAILAAAFFLCWRRGSRAEKI